MQLIFSILSRNGYLNNFSATFVDPRDIITTIYNFNLEKFITNGYGKHIFMFKQDLDAFKNKSEYTDQDKQMTILKTLIILTYNKLCRESLTKIDKTLYYSPLMLVLVNTVNFSQIKNEEGDLKIFFNEIEKITSGNIDPGLFDKAIKELKKDIKHSSFVYENQGIEIDKVLMESIEPKTILSKVFNADKPGKIEILVLPDNDKEILKMKTSDTNFALIKIGDAKSWVIKNLQNYEINENYTDTSAFNQLESLDNINILMGSRAFYEGWDSTRPNIILYINIGSSLESKKFVLQSIGRGVRIAPLPSQRRRFKFIQSDLQKDSPLLKINEIIYSPLETLFVMGTNSKVLAEVITTLKIEDSMNEVVSRQITKLGNTKVLFIPTYPDDSFIMITDQTSTRMRISKSDLEYAKSVFSGLDERIILCKYNISPNLLNIIKKSLDPTNFQTYYEYRKEDSHPDLIIQKLITHFNIYIKNQNKLRTR